jgi:hypothetical protein
MVRYAEQLASDGYTVVRNVVSNIDDLAAQCMEYFDDHSVSEMPASAVLAHELLAGVLVHRHMVGAYEEIFACTPVLFPNVSVRRNVYTPWHIDRGFVGKGAYIRDPGFHAYQFGLYMGAGGLDVRPGSQRILRSCPFRSTSLIDVYSYALAPFYRPRSIEEARPGDVIVWDCRVFHRGTPHAGQEPSPEKLALYWSMSDSHAEHEAAYMGHLLSRGRRARPVNLVSPHASTARYGELEHLDLRQAFAPQVRRQVEVLLGDQRLRLSGDSR